MKLDRELYRKAYEAYREWSEAADRARPREPLSSAEAWERYAALVAFCWRLCPQPSERQRREKMEALNRYYARVQRLEEWRRRVGKTT